MVVWTKLVGKSSIDFVWTVRTFLHNYLKMRSNVIISWWVQTSVIVLIITQSHNLLLSWAVHQKDTKKEKIQKNTEELIRRFSKGQLTCYLLIAYDYFLRTESFCLYHITLALHTLPIFSWSETNLPPPLNTFKCQDLIIMLENRRKRKK